MSSCNRSAEARSTRRGAEGAIGGRGERVPACTPNQQQSVLREPPRPPRLRAAVAVRSALRDLRCGSRVNRSIGHRKPPGPSRCKWRAPCPGSCSRDSRMRRIGRMSGSTILQPQRGGAEPAEGRGGARRVQLGGVANESQRAHQTNNNQFSANLRALRVSALRLQFAPRCGCSSLRAAFAVRSALRLQFAPRCGSRVIRGIGHRKRPDPSRCKWRAPRLGSCSGTRGFGGLSGCHPATAARRRGARGGARRVFGGAWQTSPGVHTQPTTISSPRTSATSAPPRCGCSLLRALRYPCHPRHRPPQDTGPVTVQVACAPPGVVFPGLADAADWADVRLNDPVTTARRRGARGGARRVLLGAWQASPGVHTKPTTISSPRTSATSAPPRCGCSSLRAAVAVRSALRLQFAPRCGCSLLRALRYPCHPQHRPPQDTGPVTVQVLCAPPGVVFPGLADLAD